MKKKAFTLMEMMIVLVIIGILMSLSVGGAMKILAQAKIGQAEADIAALASAVSRYERDIGKYPATLSNANLGSYIDFDSAGNYLDPWGSPYTYVNPGTNNINFVDISTTAPNGGGTIGNW